MRPIEEDSVYIVRAPWVRERLRLQCPVPGCPLAFFRLTFSLKCSEKYVRSI